MARLQITGLTKSFGNVVAVRDLSIDIADREFLVLLGPSGAGKTTTLRCVAGVEHPNAGSICFDDQDVGHVSPAVREVAQKLHIEHLLERRPAQLSGGEQQRVALGRAMVRRPRAFLMDEPLTNLDFKLRVEMRSELKRIHSELNTTLFYVTNDQTEAMSLADRIAVLNAGVLQQVGTPEEVYDHPVNRFVAGFIGNIRMNFLQCVLRNDDVPSLNGRNGAWQLPISTSLRDTIRARTNSEALIMGVRPED